ncbi:DMT family transporter [Micromonospora yasonensis]|uniref:DMT family transporter n=1 Tax=Micromonospora yasonensis TaxID=1128667 RepID=UPI00222EB1C8|nr:DMT family transporter [Micromonospora yasonensis]MCW3843720.1 DMT family transporter [Micromonospora yasonensis]
MLIADVLAGTPIALGAAAAFGASSVLQFRASRRTPEEPAGRPSLLFRLVRQRGWRWSVVLAGVAFALQIAALSLIPLVLVQPLLITGLLWYVLLFALVERVRPDRAILLESVLCLLGLSAFLLVARPSVDEGRNFQSVWAAVLLGVAVVGSVALCLTTAVGLSRRWRPLPLALAAGICYGVTAGLVSSIAFHFQGNPTALLGQWQTYAIIVLGPFGVLLSQNAYQAGPMGAPALATITVSDPLVAIGVGLLWLGEEIRTAPWALVGEVLALAVLVAGVFLLARRAPHVDGG